MKVWLRRRQDAVLFFPRSGTPDASPGVAPVPSSGPGVQMSCPDESTMGSAHSALARPGPWGFCASL